MTLYPRKSCHLAAWDKSPRGWPPSKHQKPWLYSDLYIYCILSNTTKRLRSLSHEIIPKSWRNEISTYDSWISCDVSLFSCEDLVYFCCNATYHPWKFQLVGKDAHLNLFEGKLGASLKNRSSFSWSVIRKGNANEICTWFWGPSQQHMVCSGYPTVSWRVGSPEKVLSTCASWVVPSFPSTKMFPGSRLLGFDFDALETFFQSQGSGAEK